MKKVCFSSLDTPEIQERRKKVNNLILNDKDIKKIIEDNNISNPDEYMTYFNEFISVRDRDTTFYPIFKLRGKKAEIRYAYRNAQEEERKKKGVINRLEFDENNERLRGLNFKDLEEDPHNMNFIKSFKNWAESYTFPTYKKGVWLSGSFGIGKTYLMGAFANELNNKGAGVRMTSLETLLNAEKESFDYKGVISPVELAKKAEVLILDDLATEYHTEWAHGNIYDLLNYRMNNELPTFFTSNMSIKEYIAEISRRVGTVQASRLQARINFLTDGKTLVMGGDDKR